MACSEFAKLLAVYSDHRPGIAQQRIAVLELEQIELGHRSVLSAKTARATAGLRRVLLRCSASQEYRKMKKPCAYLLWLLVFKGPF
jgi:hypothetical protein